MYLKLILIKKLGGYVWDKNDILFKLFEKFIVNLEPVTHNIINSLQHSILWKIAYKHWNEKMARKKLRDPYFIM